MCCYETQYDYSVNQVDFTFNFEVQKKDHRDYELENMDMKFCFISY